MKWKALGHQQVLPVHEPSSLSRQIKFLDPNQAVDNGWRDTFQRLWLRFKMRAFSTSTGSPSDGLGRGTATTSDSSMVLRMRPEDTENTEDWIVDEVVVDGNDQDHHSGSEKGTSTGTRRTDSATSIHAEVHGPRAPPETQYYRPSLPAWLKYRVYPSVKVFFNPCFDEPEKESEYKAMTWWSAKPFAFWASIFLVCNWVLYLGLNLQSTRESLYAQICYYGGLTLLTAPLPFFVAYNIPKRHDVFFQIWFCLAVWFCAFTELIQIKHCGFFRHKGHDNCHGKDFLAMSYYSTGLPAIMMFIISKRLYNAIAQVIFFILLMVLIIPDQDIYARNAINFVIFSIFLQALHFSTEVTNRRIFMMNYQLKLAYQGQDKARIKETRANNAKKRFASYIFHEVRVPLNTATLAFQNLQTENVFKNIPQQEVEVEALEASLSMMQQVLNDALDFHKMDAGRFDSHPRPFQLHRVINSVLRPIDVTAHAQNLKLIIDLDKNIDLVPSPVDSSDGLWVVGDELRLRQALTNLTSNAVKFSFDGGEVAVTTKLINILPAIKPERRPSDKEKETSGEKRMARQTSDEDVRPRSLVFRLEVKDSGPGVKPSDMVEGGLFQPFVQTNVGISSGKGTGLGLAIVRQIVTRSGGRLGVRSQRGQGAVFWIELTYPLATESDIEAARQHSASSLTPSSSQLSRPPLSLLHSDPYHSFTTYSTAPPESLPSDATAVESPEPLKEKEKILSLPETLSVITVTAPTPPQELSVLVVDDDPLTRTLMKRMLSKLGCKVDTADDGQQFLDLMTQSDAPQYDMICLDNYMPRVTGEQAVGELRALGRTDLVIGCTGNALSEDQSSYLKAGADRVLTKPIMLKDLKSALELARSRKVRE